jgi:glycine oxidase
LSSDDEPGRSPGAGARTQSRARRSPDVVIIGGGIMGCAIAFRLAARQLAVTVIEKAIPGAEASSAAAGMLAPQMEADGPGPMFDLGLRSRALYPAVAAELRDATGIDIGYVKSGVILVALSEAHERELGTRRTWQLARGLRVEPVAGGALPGLEPALGPAVRSGLRFPDEAQVHPPSLARAYSQAAALAGVEFLQGRVVRRVGVDGDRVTGVELDDGTLAAAAAVVVAAGSWSGLVEGAGLSAGMVRPARGQLVSIETRPPLFRHVLSVPHQGYLVPRRDGTVVAGSTVEMVGFRKEVTVGGLADILLLARSLVPGLAEAPVTGSWSNFRPRTADLLPILGATPVRGLFVSTGHYRNGILLAPVTADSMAALVATGHAGIDLSPFSLSRFTRPA